MHARLILCLCLLVIGLSAFIGVPSSDPYFIPDVLNQNNLSTNYNGGYSYRDTNGRTPRTNQAASAYSSCITWVEAGQSLDAGNAPTNYTPTNASNVHIFNPFDGAIYPGVDPSLGASGLSGSALGNPHGRTADKVINAGAPCIVRTPLAFGGSVIADWALGGTLYLRLKDALNHLYARGFTSGVYVLWGQGPSDCAIGTSQSAYVASGNALFSDLASVGNVAKIFVAEQSWNVGSTCAAIQNAQTQAAPSGLINHSASPPIWAGPNSDSLGAGSRQADNEHWTDAGADSYASLWQTSLHASGAPF